jgi:hypothetical protein
VFRWLFAQSEAIVYDFGARVVSLRTKKEVAANEGGWWFERVKIRRVGNQFYLTGEICDHPGGIENPYKGVVFWYMLSEIEQMREFPTYEAAIKSWQATQKLSGAGVQQQKGSRTSEAAQPGAPVEGPRN